MICGVDEAGRGPIIGPMVIAGTSANEENIELLKKIGVKDSKLISKTKRDELYEEVKKLTKYEIVILDAEKIDEYNFSGTNLNQMEAKYIAKIIDKLNADLSIIDSPEPNPKKFEKMIEERMKNKLKLIAEHKADANHTIAAAASILAKVTRDRIIEEISKEVGKNIGSGYPSDPITKKFLEENFRGKVNKYLRKCWKTYQNLEKPKQVSLSDFGNA